MQDDHLTSQEIYTQHPCKKENKQGKIVTTIMHKTESQITTVLSFATQCKSQTLLMSMGIFSTLSG